MSKLMTYDVVKAGGNDPRAVINGYFNLIRVIS